MVGPPPVPAWVAWTIARIDSMEICEVEAIVRPPPGEPRSRASTGVGISALRAARCVGVRPGERDARLRSARRPDGRPSHRRVGPLDVVVSFLPTARSKWAGPAPRHGVWTIVPGTSAGRRAPPCRFWDVCLRHGTTATASRWRTDRAGRCSSGRRRRTDPLSLTRTATLRHGRRRASCVRSLRRPIARGSPPVRGPIRSARRAPRRPPSRCAMRRGQRARGAAAKGRAAWLGASGSSRCGSTIGRRPRPPAPCDALPNPPGRYLADPFPIELDGRHYLFVEDYSRAAGRGVISVWRPGRTGRGHRRAPCSSATITSRIRSCSSTRERSTCSRRRARPAGSSSTAPSSSPTAGRSIGYCSTGSPPSTRRCTSRTALLWLFANVDRWPRGSRASSGSSRRPSLDAEWRPHPQNPIVTDWGPHDRPAGCTGGAARSSGPARTARAATAGR